MAKSFFSIKFYIDIPSVFVRCMQHGIIIFCSYFITPRACARVKQSVCMTVVVGTKIARSRVLGACACCKYDQSVDIVEKVVSICFELLKVTH